MHIAIVSMHEEPELPWVNKSNIQVLDQYTLLMYAMSSGDAYYHLYNGCRPTLIEQVYLCTLVFFIIRR